MSFNQDLTGRYRVGQLNTLADLKTISTDNPLLWENVGTGTFTFIDNRTKMDVGPGQYCIRRQRVYNHYSSGKSKLIEPTFDTFAPQEGVVKIIGYFSSSHVAPYDEYRDGFFIQSDMTDGISFQIWRGGDKIYSKPQKEFNGPFNEYNFNNFTFSAIDYLWLGGLGARLHFKAGADVVLADVCNYTGDMPAPFTISPSQNVRYEIRSTGGSGSMTAICSQVASEGSIDEMGEQYGIPATSYINCATTGTNYPLIGVRKNINSRYIPVRLLSFNALVGSNNDQIILTIQKNPVLSGTPTWEASGVRGTEKALGNGTITVTTEGTILYCAPLSSNSILPGDLLKSDFLSWLGNSIDNTSDQIWICGRPLTAGVQICPGLIVKVY